MRDGANVKLRTKGTSKPELVALASGLRSAVPPLARQMRQAATEWFTPTQLSVLGSITRFGPLSLGDLAAREKLSPPMITKVIDVLTSAEVVERLVHERDRRVCLVRTTAKGIAWVEQTRAEQDQWLADRLAHLSREQLDALNAAMPALEQLLSIDD